MQTLLAIPDFVEYYDKNAFEIFNKIKVDEIFIDFNCQLARVLNSLNSTDDFSKVYFLFYLTLFSTKFQEGFDFNGIEPKSFREIAGKGHSEFSTAKQQDVEQYIRY